MCNVTAAYESPYIKGNLQYVLIELGRSFEGEACWAAKTLAQWALKRLWDTVSASFLCSLADVVCLLQSSIYTNVLSLPEVQYLEKAMRIRLQVSVELFWGKTRCNRERKGTRTKCNLNPAITWSLTCLAEWRDCYGTNLDYRIATGSKS